MSRLGGAGAVAQLIADIPLSVEVWKQYLTSCKIKLILLLHMHEQSSFSWLLCVLYVLLLYIAANKTILNT